MSITVEAVYENGVLKPSEPLPFKEQEKVQITVVVRQPTLAERIVARARALPPLPAAPPVAELLVMVLPVTVRVAGVPALSGLSDRPSL